MNEDKFYLFLFQVNIRSGDVNPEHKYPHPEWGKVVGHKWEIRGGYNHPGPARAAVTRATNAGGVACAVWCVASELHALDGDLDLQAEFNAEEAKMLESGKRADELQARLAAGETVEKSKRKPRKARTWKKCGRCRGSGLIIRHPYGEQVPTTYGCGPCDSTGRITL